MHSIPRVMLLGRTNVGKSTLFNRLIEKPKALTSPRSHTTRNVNIDTVYWQGFQFELIDSGGIETIIPKKKQKKALKVQGGNFEIDIIKQTQRYIKSADLILFIVDGKEGLLPQDKEINTYLKRHFKNIPTFVVVNKIEGKKNDAKISEFYSLGFGDPHPIAAISGRGTGDLLDVVVTSLKKLKKIKKAEKIEIPNAISVVFIGKPNVGKSSLLNALIGEERVIVSDIPGTTRESFDTLVEYEKKTYRFIDTAGLRKRVKVRAKDLEKASVRKTIESAGKADVSLLMIDISKSITTQDLRLAEMLIKQKTSVIIVVNKWDLILDKSTNTQKDLKEYIYRRFPFLTWAPMIFISAKSTKGVNKIYKIIQEVQESRHIEISDNALSRFLKQSIKKHRPARAKGIGQPYLTTFKQIKTNPPLFRLTIRKKDTLNPTYLRYLENQLKQKFNIVGTPLTIKIKR